jgi:Nuclease-related domain
MARRQAGHRLKRQLRQRRREIARTRWKPLAVFALSYAVCAVAVTLLISWLSGHSWGVFMGGIWLGGFVVMNYSIFTFIDGEASRLSNGFDAESNTAHELRRLRRDGWRVVHNIHFEAGDVDHVAVGPGGVVAIETKASTADWDFLVRQGVISNWAKQAKQGAFRTHHLVKSRAKIDIVTAPIVVTWVGGQPAEQTSIDGVTVMGGSLIVDYLRELRGMLDDTTRDRMYAALSEAGEQFDESVGVTRRRGFGRLIYRSG